MIEEPLGFHASLGGDARILLSVSKMDVLDGTIGFPVTVASQYLAF